MVCRTPVQASVCRAGTEGCGPGLHVCLWLTDTVGVADRDSVAEESADLASSPAESTATKTSPRGLAAEVQTGFSDAGAHMRNMACCNFLLRMLRRAYNSGCMTSNERCTGSRASRLTGTGLTPARYAKVTTPT